MMERPSKLLITCKSQEVKLIYFNQMSQVKINADSLAIK